MMSALLDRPTEATIDGPEFVPDPIHWSVNDFCELLALPRFHDRRFILIDGEIIEMPRPNAPHDGCVYLAVKAFEGIVPAGFIVRGQSGLPLGLDTDPIPDVAVVAGSIRDYLIHQPTTAALVVEVSDTTLRTDLKIKAHLYAAAAIAEYLVVDVTNRRLHLHRDPVADADADADAPRGFRYASVQVLTTADMIVPLAFPDKTIRVADLLP